jgi:hypothetical protein
MSLSHLTDYIKQRAKIETIIKATSSRASILGYVFIRQTTISNKSNLFCSLNIVQNIPKTLMFVTFIVRNGTLMFIMWLVNYDFLRKLEYFVAETPVSFYQRIHNIHELIDERFMDLMKCIHWKKVKDGNN